MRGRIILTAVLFVGLLVASGGAAAAPQPAPDACGGGPADAEVGPNCLDPDADGQCEYCWDPDVEEYVWCG